VRLRPVPAGAQLPAVDDVADQVDVVGVVAAQEVEQLLGLASARAEMKVGEEQGADPDEPVASPGSSAGLGSKFMASVSPIPVAVR